MDFVRLQRLAEVKRRLKPVLDELGLTTKYVYRFGFKDIGFHNHDNSIVHSVRLNIAAVFDKPVDVWQGVTMSYLNGEEIPIGDNGWTHNYPDWGGDLETLGNDNDNNFAYIEECLRKYPLVRLGDSHPNMFGDPDIAKIYKRVEDPIRDVTSGPISFDRTDGILGISFVVDQTNETWRMSFDGLKVAIAIDRKPHSEMDRGRDKIEPETLLRAALREKQISTLRFY